MRIAYWNNNLAVRLPKALVRDLGLKSGDDLKVVSAKPGHITVVKDDHQTEAIEQAQAIKRRKIVEYLRYLRENPLPVPENYVFDREEANVDSKQSNSF